MLIRPPSQSPPPKLDRPAPARTGRKPRLAAGAGKEDDGDAAAEDLRHHRRRLVMEKVTILKRGEAMKPSPPVLPGSNRWEDPSISPVDPVYACPGFLNPSISPVDPVYAGPGFSNPSISPVDPVYVGPGFSNPSISPVHPVYVGPGFSNPSISPVHPVYAGPGYSTFSPLPSFVPCPAFLRPLAASEEATRSLLRLLRLN